MVVEPKFRQYRFDINTGAGLSQKLREAIRGSWDAKTREEVESVTRADKFEGEVYRIDFSGERKPPSLGGYVEALIRHGWGYLTYEEGVLYTCRIVPSNQNDKDYMFEGRENIEFDIPPIRKVDVPSTKNENLQLDNASLRDRRRLKSLRNDILSSWESSTLNTVTGMTCSTSNYNSYIINTESNAVLEENDDGNLYFKERPTLDSPLGKHVDCLLHNGWAVATVKGNSLFVSRLERLDEPAGSATYGYKFEGSDCLIYTPTKCDFCEHEKYELLVTDTEESKFSDSELPVYSRACEQCVKEKPYPTAKQFRED